MYLTEVIIENESHSDDKSGFEWFMLSPDDSNEAQFEIEVAKDDLTSTVIEEASDITRRKIKSCCQFCLKEQSEHCSRIHLSEDLKSKFADLTQKNV